MRYSWYVAFTQFFFILLTIFSTEYLVFAEQGHRNMLIFVIDSRAVLEKSEAFKDITNKIEKRRSELKELSVKNQHELKISYEQLGQKRGKISKQEYEKRNLELSKKAKAFHENAYKEKARIDNVLIESGLIIERELSNIVRQFVSVFDDENVILILDKSAAIFSSEKLDITETVLNELNKKIPTISIDFNK